MRIDRLKLQNFNGFESFEIDFDPHFNLLVGDNGSGKTSVLDSLSILIDAWLLGINQKEIGGSLHLEEVRVVAFAHQDSYTFEKQFPVRIEASGEVMDDRVTWAIGRIKAEKASNYVEIENLSKIAMDASQKVMTNSLVVLPVACSYGTERLWFETRHRKQIRSQEDDRGQPSRLLGYEDCNEFEIQESALLNWIRAQILDGIQIGQQTLAFRAMEKAVVNCVEGATFLRYSERYKDAIVGFEPDGPQFFKNLSDGQRIMLTLVGDLVRRATALNPHLGEEVLQKTPGVVLIDELDLHLHPKWQRRIIRDLKLTFPQVQFIATTHSPQLIGEAKPEELRVLRDWKVIPVELSYGLDSDRILEEIQEAERRSPDIEVLIHEIALAIDADRIEEARTLLDSLEDKLGPHDREVLRPRRMLKDLETAR